MKNSFYLKYLVIAIISIHSQSNCYGQNLESTIDSLLQEKYSENTPGGVFLIAQKENIIYKKAFGLSNLELSIPMQTDNVFEIGSITKQFTAVAILILMEKGKLNLNDEITKFIPDYPTNGYRITIHHLLTHTSGIKDFTKIKGLNEISKKDLTPSELINFFKNEPIDFAPGDQFKYNNSGYAILGYIIELITKQSYSDFVSENIFKKLKMLTSQYASHYEVIQNRASGYHNKNGYINNREVSFTIPYSSGALMSTVDDMFKWQMAIKKNLLISKEATKKAFTNYTLNNGKPINYGYGWHIKAMHQIVIREHGGAIFGFKSMAVYIPESDIYVIALTNCDCNSPTTITRKIAELVLKN
tara:strand:+ start:20670 stop:21743 length:1074 start_codon:yes stop_codon:yes gene_type:complete